MEHNLQCPKCGTNINPGDQVCRECGEKILNVTFSISDLEGKHDLDNKKKNNQKVLISSILLVSFLVLMSFVLSWFFFKRS